MFVCRSFTAWDSTGEEGVYAWSAHFNDTKTATNTVNAILAYQPTVAHWGYNGNARCVHPLRAMRASTHV